MKQHYVFDLRSLAKTVTSVSELCNEATLYLENNLLTIVQLDPANVALIKTTCPYDGNKKATEITINTTNLSRILNKCFLPFDDDEVIMSFKQGKEEELVMTLKNKKNECTLTGWKTDKGKQKVPELKFATNHKIKKSVLARAINACHEIEDYLAIQHLEGRLHFHTKGDTIKYSLFDESRAKGKNCKSRLSIEYLRKAVCGKKSVLTGNDITLSLSQDYPLQLTDEYDDLFILAPRVDDL